MICPVAEFEVPGLRRPGDPDCFIKKKAFGFGRIREDASGVEKWH